jgi:hypothetical protein
MPTTESPKILGTPRAEPEYIDALDPRGPWRARRDWASGDLYFNAATHFSVFVMLFFGLAMLAVGFAFAYGLYNELVYGTYRAGDWGALLPIVICGSFGILLTAVATRAVIQGLKWRGSHFHLVNRGTEGERRIDSRRTHQGTRGVPARIGFRGADNSHP